MRPKGQISIGGVLLTLGIVAGGYWCVLFLPLYIDHWEVVDIVKKAFNSYGIVHDATLRAELDSGLGELKFVTHTEQALGQEVTKPGFAVSPDNPVIIADEVNKMLEVTFRYDRTVRLVPTDKVKVVHFVASQKGKFPH